MKKRTKNALKLLFKLIVVLAYFTALIKFFNVGDICEKMEYGLSVIILTILFFDNDNNR